MNGEHNPSDVIRSNVLKFPVARDILFSILQCIFLADLKVFEFVHGVKRLT